MVSILQLPDDVLAQVIRLLDTQDVKLLLMFPGLRDLANEYLYKNSKYVIYFDDKSLDSTSENDIKKDTAECEVLQSLQQHIEENDTMDTDGDDSDFELVMDTDDSCVSPKHEGIRTDTHQDLPGLRVSSLVNCDKITEHIARFRNFQVNISVSYFKDMIVQLDLYHNLIRAIFECGSEGGFDRHNHTRKNIKLLIQLNYSLNSFNDVKDCLINIDKVSEYFNHQGNNNVQIDLELNKR
ncbi:predicted protein [Scheffersomyces stipitis CBS 6054]|uniref:F-box domain-containing protein n=1 Tax=Scheffersomyces stipitis (strain ATCC 58785 / CBS 6054 / NBRC 10063 / NRRL Y-11545) TaxID=322104 RepID=A3LPF5_PICST|nr:predicted protein [Scheffersomyces stipitis CBS 6054]ABN64484.2 predicted protein [Scheffersomyces stipitis CBS 6054]